MKREETKIIEQTLYRNLFGNNPKLAREYGTNEVTLGFSRDGRINNGKTEIVDFLSYDVIVISKHRTGIHIVPVYDRVPV